jgi:hypothetical protein
VPTNYPNGNNSALGPAGADDFRVTTNPAGTSLSQSGPGSDGRNHAQSHEDMGDAIQALQEHASVKTHDHSGDNTDRTKGGKLAWANTHQTAAAPTTLTAAQALADTDDSALAIHHTLATSLPTSGTAGQFQAAPGHHTHSYPTLIDTPLRYCTSDSRPSGVPLGTMIYETDKNRMRVWGQFNAANTANTGIDGTDSFNRVGVGNLGTTLWRQVYTPGSFGVMATPDGNHASWTDNGNDPARCIATRISAADAITETDDQIITWLVGGTGVESYLPFSGGTAASNDMYFRMSNDGTSTVAPSSYLRLTFTYDEWGRGLATLYGTQTGPAGEQRIGSLTGPVNLTNLYWVAEMVGDTLSLYYGNNLEGSLVEAGKIKDTYGVSRRCSASHTTSAAHTASCVKYRGWGIGMVAGNRAGLDTLFGQVTPAEISLVNIRDAVYYTGQARWQLLPVANMPIVRLLQTQPQTITANGSLIQWTEKLEDSFDFYSTASTNSLTIKEPGLYSLNVGIQWNVQGVPELGTAIACVNGRETALLNTAYQKVGTPSLPAGSPTFSQTLALSGKVRLAVNDVLSIKVRHTAPSLLQILSYFDQSSKISSRLDLLYVAP